MPVRGGVGGVAPDGDAFFLRQHLSFVKLPDDGFRVRAADPRTGFFGASYNDYAQPIQGRLMRSLADRFRLERVNPSDPNSAIKKPIVYYVDPGIPEPLRTATVEGAKFW